MATMTQAGPFLNTAVLAARRVRLPRGLALPSSGCRPVREQNELTGSVPAKERHVRWSLGREKSWRHKPPSCLTKRRATPRASWPTDTGVRFPRQFAEPCSVIAMQCSGFRLLGAGNGSGPLNACSTCFRTTPRRMRCVVCRKRTRDSDGAVRRYGFARGAYIEYLKACARRPIEQPSIDMFSV